MYQQFDSNDEDARKRMRNFFGPQMVDQQIRSAIQHCWMALPEEQQNIDDLERQIRRIVDRALRDFRDDATAFTPNE